MGGREGGDDEEEGDDKILTLTILHFFTLIHTTQHPTLRERREAEAQAARKEVEAAAAEGATVAKLEAKLAAKEVSEREGGAGGRRGDDGGTKDLSAPPSHHQYHNLREQITPSNPQ